MFTDVMLDLETIGTNYNAAIIQIGACYFDRYTGRIGEEFILNVDANSSLIKGFEANWDTIKWWFVQSDQARRVFALIEGIDVEQAIHKVNVFLSEAKIIWSHATFDFVILMNHFHKLNIRPKFGYKTARDLRTLVDLADVKCKSYPREGVHHNALDDCRYQIKYAVDCFKKIEEKK